MTSPQKREQLAQKIDTWVNDITSKGGGDDEILEGMNDYMAPFKKIMDAAAPGELDALTLKYEGFYRFANLLERLAEAIADGSIDVPGKPKRRKPKGNGFGN
ncbi:hypothetical protein [Acaryochloris sp. IP29b_bin.148]|uniref:hypothetical protein n=1 Tax=Acaryochloris sp. IP29b_bin.148 TaxID=2969218 RepID=UPI00263377E2|nr:hypothetical protein [Acaryochloris sp. IP29b_bin.148]